MNTGITGENVYILVYRFMDDGRPYLDRQLVWRERDIESNLSIILSALSTNDEVLLIQVSDYNNIMTSKPDDWKKLHEDLRSHSITLIAGDKC